MQYSELLLNLLRNGDVVISLIMEVHDVVTLNASGMVMGGQMGNFDRNNQFRIQHYSL